MAYRIFWTPIAVQDLRDICDFISRDNPVAAQRMGEELIKQSEAMAVFPQSVWMPLPAPGTLREDLVLSAGELPGSRVLPMGVVSRFPAPGDEQAWFDKLPQIIARFVQIHSVP